MGFVERKEELLLVGQVSSSSNKFPKFKIMKFIAPLVHSVKFNLSISHIIVLDVLEAVL